MNVETAGPTGFTVTGVEAGRGPLIDLTRTIPTLLSEQLRDAADQAAKMAAHPRNVLDYNPMITAEWLCVATELRAAAARLETHLWARLTTSTLLAGPERAAAAAPAPRAAAAATAIAPVRAASDIIASGVDGARRTVERLRRLAPPAPAWSAAAALSITAWIWR